MPGDFPALGPQRCCTTLTRKPRRRLTRLAGRCRSATGGQPMVSAALIVVGALWMRKLIKIEV
jgi:hypothetical protein